MAFNSRVTNRRPRPVALMISRNMESGKKSSTSARKAADRERGAYMHEYHPRRIPDCICVSAALIEEARSARDRKLPDTRRGPDSCGWILYRAVPDEVNHREEIDR